nr:IS110 family transposase [Gordonia sp. i37]
MTVIIGDDWAEGHHDIEVMAPDGRVLARFRVEENAAGLGTALSRLGELGIDGDDVVEVGIERDNGVWVTALRGSGFRVYAVNPLQSARCRSRYSLAGAKNDARDAHVLADMVRTDRAQLRLVADDTDTVEGLKVLARTHKTLIWERTRHLNRLRYNLIQYFPAAVDAFTDLSAPESIELLTKAPTPATATRLTLTQIRAALTHAKRRMIDTRASEIRATLREPGHLGQPAELAAAHASATVAILAVIAVLNTQIANLAEKVTSAFHTHPQARIYTSQPGMGPILGARALAEFGDAPVRYRTAKARRNFAGTSPVTQQSGKRTVVSRRYVHNDRLLDTLTRQAFTAIRVSPGARSYYDRQRQRGVAHEAALRHVANRLVGILHGCLATDTLYDETIAWKELADNTSRKDRPDCLLTSLSHGMSFR